ncbi:3-hydroxybutyryl-CoA dehydrogenase [Pseudomonas sp. FW215-R2]|uniref:3-hydroxybutyryl-CoA dehydrogenase n=1 Tax=unclassified Pseudomonas TaxID=196821 RepID=UPI000C8800D6|nr:MULTISPECIES: 3-hydroxybutyryl-CoA dehydrogenase [unclassified Pseudomonas]PMX03080.1 3-hydroxybutyryl-CoA dehydrogenase [Pseudomonas sp. FW215-R2]PMX11955.1 3-hydroxybutyryl-CoA dehydrogenase [Pseudomonas sp. FW215-L1]PMX25625.1 3-hydroxybutyryl-CoA dehydrogenase [Pseudomonas sp. FW215-E1]PNA32627.1 3-hydroxybutyryl-CoA dehydrogenase [Pseudomonas sp. FW215-R4]
MGLEIVGVVGAGTMGNGIAQVCAATGLSVKLLDVSSDSLERALAVISKNLDRQISKGTLDVDEKNAILKRIETTTKVEELSGADIVIEAATENLSLKNKILNQISGLVSTACIIASNTSSLSITQLASNVSYPERFIGLHFFNPVTVMQLVEVIKGVRTNGETHELVIDLVNRLDKSAITVVNRPAFVVNRILIPMINEAVLVYQEGLASAKDIDDGMMLGCNHPIGPLALADLVGLDTLLSIQESLYEGFNDSKYRPAPLLKEMVAAGFLGRKTGRGFHEYG